MKTIIIPFKDLSMKDVNRVGGKNASLGEMLRALVPLGISVPDGFAIATDAFYTFLNENKLSLRIQESLGKIDRNTLDRLSQSAEECRNLIMESEFPENLVREIHVAYKNLLKTYGSDISVAVRSSATAEDSPEASFAGQHDSFLNVAGEADLLHYVKRCFASLYNDRAIKYRIDRGFSDMQVGLAVGVQVMVRSDVGSAGVAFTIEPETGNGNLIYVTGAWGLGESVVQGAVNTDEYYLFKPAVEGGQNAVVWKRLGDKQQMLVYGSTEGSATEWKPTTQGQRDSYVLTDGEVRILGRWCYEIEKHYNMPMDIEWAKDGITGRMYIVQARAETVHRKEAAVHIKEFRYTWDAKPLLKGKAVGRSIVSGKVCIVKSLADSGKLSKGDIIVADITNPDWNALLRKAICIVTNKGGRTSHASIVARELGIPAVVGTLHATEKLTDGQAVTVSCATGDEGCIFDGKLDWQEEEIPVKNIAHTQTKPMFILADPQKALVYATFPNEGVGLLRIEFIVNNSIQIHPMALVKFNDLPDGVEKQQIEAITRHYADKNQYFIDKLAESVGLVAAAFYPKPVIVRMSDFKTNEYAKLLGGKWYEPEEENPMLGFRGASRYYNPRYQEGFGLECAAIRKVRDEMGLVNVKVMIPFCRTVQEGKKVLQTMKKYGLRRGDNDLEVYVMAEIPSNILLAKKFSEIFDGFSIGSNDLTQLTLGLDRDSAIVSDLFDENNEAVTGQIRHLIDVAHANGVPVGLCGQAPSDYPEFARFLVACGIDSISFNPDALVRGIENIVRAESETTLVV
jgi:pyruvate, water dikinase